MKTSKSNLYIRLAIIEDEVYNQVYKIQDKRLEEGLKIMGKIMDKKGGRSSIIDVLKHLAEYLDEDFKVLFDIREGKK